MKRKTLKGLAFITMAGLVLTGCSSSEKPASEAKAGEDLVIDGELIAKADVYADALDEGSLVFYTGASEVSEQQVADEFSELTGIQVEIVRLAPNKLQERVLSENAAGKLGADLVRISGEDLIVALAEDGVFTETELTDDISGALIDGVVFDDGKYFSSFDRVYSFGYNNQVLSEDEAPKNWADLTDTKYSGQFGLVQVGAGGSTAALTRFQLDQLGEDWLKDIAANEPRVFDSSANLTDALARGEIQIGTVPIGTAYSAILEGAPITIAMPEEGAAAYPFYVGQTSASKRSNAATVFINWLLSENGQALASSLGDYPVHQGAANPTIGDVELPAADSGFAYRATLEDSLEHLQSDAKTWMDIFDYNG
ncbi:extracellular solute-binding protein [Leucobacter sp. UCMA 4100]|uniref:ABC transporter substrate-binding protein n=1 Tax=Leucobacter sp. UCMA 4100 TaxID=2810534 RepID=UPI0022EA7227|nr:extracellular solute-binding protein [Leucobacter sp. UCMA 4100]MDA3146617.1 extracellular solute-binding protein [Leucobacter sp. UCMA 4100]